MLLSHYALATAALRHSPSIFFSCIHKESSMSPDVLRANTSGVDKLQHGTWKEGIFYCDTA